MQLPHLQEIFRILTIYDAAAAAAEHGQPSSARSSKGKLSEEFLLQATHDD